MPPACAGICPCRQALETTWSTPAFCLHSAASPVPQSVYSHWGLFAKGAAVKCLSLPTLLMPPPQQETQGNLTLYFFCRLLFFKGLFILIGRQPLNLQMLSFCYGHSVTHCACILKLNSTPAMLIGIFWWKQGIALRVQCFRCAIALKGVAFCKMCLTHGHLWRMLIW